MAFSARHLSPDMVLTSISRIEQRGGRRADMIVAREDFEAVALAQQIQWLLEDCGWTIHLIWGHETGRVWPGVNVEVPEKAWAAAWDSGNALVVSLKKDHGLASSGPFATSWQAIEGQPDALDPDAEVKIIVGPKPLHWAGSAEATREQSTPKKANPATSDLKTDH